MNTPLNDKYAAICAAFGIPIQIRAVPSSAVSSYRIAEENGVFTLSVCADAPKHLGYEKLLAWGVREVLLPRLVMETQRLRLRRFTESDRASCLPLLSNEEDCFMDCCRCFRERDEAYEQRVDLFISRPQQYAVTLKESGELIGTLNVFADEARAVDAMEIGYSIARNHQRKGYAFEMLNAMLDLLQRDLFVDLVSAGVLPENKASIALLTKLGFQAEGLRHHAVWHEALDRPVDLRYFYLDRPERR